MTVEQEIQSLRGSLHKLANLPAEPLHDCDDDVALELIAKRIEELEIELESKEVKEIENPYLKFLLRKEVRIE
jgi:hypothetical protein